MKLQTDDAPTTSGGLKLLLFPVIRKGWKLCHHIHQLCSYTDETVYMLSYPSLNQSILEVERVQERGAKIVKDLEHHPAKKRWIAYESLA